jgi:hypothetical protein
VAGDGGQYALKGISYAMLAALRLFLFLSFLGEVGNQTKKEIDICVFWGPFVIDRTLLSMIE